jgi:hypothetical protein
LRLLSDGAWLVPTTIQEVHMNIRLALVFFLLLAWAQAYAADGSITISSPANGAVVHAGEKVPLSYAAMLGKGGDHMHLYVDGNRVDILRETKATTDLAALSPGKHHICLEVNTKGHVPTGVESCIDVTSK